ncbi:MAG: tripartite tricarboxylate transporter substrate binding protein [Rhodospirillales bacterium]|nr:tripartite tricarboxylate transporter substrate binding protein [Rhodospirillales bacterium]QQS10923.1 MAG: tripartite tricarboxylate transporter substrate binding protein [Rhodospirillales bacterium]
MIRRTTRRAALGAAGATLAAALSRGAHAQGADWPKQPIKFVVPFPPGGSVDPLARLVAQRLTETHGWNIVIDNRAGASGSVGTAIVAKAPPDGHSFVFVFDTHGVNPTLIPGMPFDTQKDLDPVSVVSTSSMVFSTHESRPYKSFADVVAAVKAKPDSVSFGSIGNGSLAHLTMMLLQKQGGFRILHVPYKGGAPMLQDAVAGQIDTAFSTVAHQMPQIRNGKLRPLVVTGDKRAPQLPDVPSLAEVGFPGFSAKAWWGVLAPAGTPKPIIERMNAELRRILGEPAVKQRLADQLGMDIWASSPEEMRAFVAAEIDRWGKVVRENGIKAD